ncbi:MAG TPA: hypothetical protein VL356_01660 [Acidocella sp.]|jgi:hypothetical protein|nr:hypothetical protein [Acidocella sp.]
MSKVDLYELGVKLLGDEPPRLGTLRDVINQVNATLAQSRAPTQGAATAAGGADPRPRVSLHKPRQGSPISGMREQAAAGVAARPLLQPDAASSFDVTPATGRPIIHAAHVPRRNAPASVPVAQHVASGTPSPEHGHARAKRHADRVTAAELPSLLATATPDGMRDEQALQAVFIRANDDGRYKAPLAGIPAGAEAHVALWYRTVSSLRNVASFASGRAGATNQDRNIQNHPVRRAAMAGESDMGRDGETRVGAAIEGTWRRIRRPGGKAAAPVGDIAYSGAAGGGAADGATIIGAIVTATLAVATEQLAAREQPPGRDGTQLGGVPVPGATPDRPVYTRIVTDQSPIPTMVTNHDALTSATVNMLAQHQASMPTAPTGLNNHLVPPAPGVPAPGSYQP